MNVSAKDDVFTASAAEARKRAREYRRTAEYARLSQSGHKHGAKEPTRYRQFCMAAVLAHEERAATEDRVAELYEEAASAWPKVAP
jgi:hypothetical protein